MDYHRPIDSFNASKQAERAERCYFREPGERRECTPYLNRAAGLQQAA
ncbi:hypothetical protein [Allochromatium vinosum]|nr:hypothetical protein [Allochromatium vinosum]